MDIGLLTTHKITPRNLAEALAKATPQEFAAFWFAFAEVCKDEKTLDGFAQAMAPEFGGRRKDPFKKLAALVQFHEIQNERMQSA